MTKTYLENLHVYVKWLGKKERSKGSEWINKIFIYDN